jgi:hypothetical protein
MMLAPVVALSGTIRALAPGEAGVYQTLGVMRAMVNAHRTDLAMRNAATSAIFLTPERNELHEVEALFALVRDNVRYVRDVYGVETLTAPGKTLALRLGDCDDQSVLLATLLESVGYPTRFVVAAYQDAGQLEHVYLQTFAGGQWIDMDPTERRPMGWAPPDPLTLLIERV